MSNSQIIKIDEQEKIRNTFSTDTFKTMLAIADKLNTAGCFSGNIKNAEQAFAIIQAGYEMGIQPMEAVNSFYIVNGKITIYGVALSKRLRQHGWSITFPESTEQKCTATISKGTERHEYSVTAEEVKKLGSQAMAKAPKDKLKWHALSRLVRFNVPEVLGSVSYVHEEVEGSESFRPSGEYVDIPAVEEERESARKILSARLDSLKKIEDFEKAKSEIQVDLEKLPSHEQSEFLAELSVKIEKLKDNVKPQKTEVENPVTPTL